MPGACPGIFSFARAIHESPIFAFRNFLCYTSSKEYIPLLFKGRDTMKKNLVMILPFLLLPLFLPIYIILDNLILVDVFGCGCVPSTQSNMFNISFNANDLRLTIFSALSIGLFVWSVYISKIFNKKIAKFLYCSGVLIVNMLLTLWVVKTFMWA